MESYPSEFASKMVELANAAAQWAALDGSGESDAAEEARGRLPPEDCKGQLEEMNVLEEGACQQLVDIVWAAASLAKTRVFGGDEGEAAQLLEDASSPQPDAVAEELWRRTQSLCLAAAAAACKERAGDEDGAQAQRKALQRHSRFIAGFGTGRGPRDGGEYASRAAEVMPGTVVMFSGCMDSQTSADVQNAASFGLPEDAGPGGAGGACTNAMMKALYEQEEYSWCSLLRAMRGVLDGSYTQIPMLSSSRAMDMTSPFSVAHDSPSGRYRALLVGINYVGSSCELRGCHNDVETMKRYLLGKGYSEDDMRILMDDGEHDSPDNSGVRAGMQWLVESAGAGDSLFFHYSGHGASVKDDDGDEKDGKDECLCPCDYSSAGLLRDDDVFQLLVGPLPDGVRLTCVLDCCHSGTILDLPYMFKADDESLEAAEGGSPMMGTNPDFDFGKILQVIQDHPAACAGAALVAGLGAAIAYHEMDGEQRQQVGGMLLGMAKSWFN